MYNIAVLGATGNVGRRMLATLAERKIPIKNLAALASEKSAGSEIEYLDGRKLTVQNLYDFDFHGIDVVLSSAGSKVISEVADKITKAGAVIIDNSSHFRYDPKIPLIVPEVNPGDLLMYKNKNIIANPNCSTIQMVVALKPLHDAFKIKRVVVSTYQAASGAGKAGIDQLLAETKGAEVKNKTFSKQIAFNVIPHIDVFMESNSTKEEWKMTVETQKILDSSIKVHANCARIPVVNGHSEYVNIETELPIDEQSARRVLEGAPGLKVLDSDIYATPFEVSGTDEVFISRLRKDLSVEHGLSFWCVADNLRKGAALNAVQILELLINTKPHF